VSGALNGDTFTVSAPLPPPSPPRPGLRHRPTVTGTKLGNYTVVYDNGTLTVGQATLTVTAANASRAYGAANPAFTGTVSGALNGDTFTVSGTSTATVASPAGTYAIVPTVTGTNLANYTVVYDNGTLTVGQATLTVTAANASRAYGAANPAFTGTVSGALTATPSPSAAPLPPPSPPRPGPTPSSPPLPGPTWATTPWSTTTEPSPSARLP